jgi:hypothetical protein
MKLYSVKIYSGFLGAEIISFKNINIGGALFLAGYFGPLYAFWKDFYYIDRETIIQRY